MSGDLETELMTQEWALLRLAYRYAQAVDRYDGDAAADCFTEDGRILSPAATLEGREQIRTVIPAKMKELFLRTLHVVGNQVVRIDGDSAEGETYCVAHHIMKAPDGSLSKLEWGLRYQDRFVRIGGRWYFRSRDHRQLVWSRTTTVQDSLG
jgi:uncharacterized protein (TIGR02246 family)